MHFHNLKAFFVPFISNTSAYDDVRNSWIIRLSMPNVDNIQFPCTAEVLLDAVQNNEKHIQVDELVIPLSNKQFSKLVTENPVHAADVFRKLVIAVFETLLDVPIANGADGATNSQKTKPLSERNKGLFHDFYNYF
jgi:hypothetical protein